MRKSQAVFNELLAEASNALADAYALSFKPGSYVLYQFTGGHPETIAGIYLDRAAEYARRYKIADVPREVKRHVLYA